MPRFHHHPRLWLRFVGAVLREFRGVLALFLLLIFGGGLLVWARPDFTEDYWSACYAVFALTFFENTLGFPREWYLRLLWFATPIVGITLVAEGVASFGVMLLNRNSQMREWNVVVASSLRKHVIVCGLGRVGYCIVEELVRIGTPVVAIEKRGENPFVTQAQERGVAVLTGDAKQLGVLLEANLEQADGLIAATDDDLDNLEIGLTVKERNPAMNVVVRMFNPSLAQKVTSMFKLPTISSSHTAAPVFAAAATHRTIHHSFQIGGIHLHLADMVVQPQSALLGRTLLAVQQEQDITFVLHQRGEVVDLHPSPDLVLLAGDKVIVMAGEDKILRLETLMGMR